MKLGIDLFCSFVTLLLLVLGLLVRADKISMLADYMEQQEEPPLYQFNQDESEMILRSSKYDMEQFFKLVFQMADLESVQNINQYEFYVQPVQTILNCMTENFHKDLRDGFLKCGTETDEMFPDLPPRPYLREMNDGYPMDRPRTMREGYHIPHSSPFNDVHKDRIRELLVGKCFLNSIGEFSSRNVTDFIMTMMKRVIDDTSLETSNKDKAIIDLQTCLGSMKDVTSFFEFFGNLNPVVIRNTEPMIDAMFNNIQQYDYIAEIIKRPFFRDLIKRHIGPFLKGIVCFVESLAKNGCANVNSYTK